jgi:hypothetical protein
VIELRESQPGHDSDPFWSGATPGTYIQSILGRCAQIVAELRKPRGQRVSRQPVLREPGLVRFHKGAERSQELLRCDPSPDVQTCTQFLSGPAFPQGCDPDRTWVPHTSGAPRQLDAVILSHFPQFSSRRRWCWGRNPIGLFGRPRIWSPVRQAHHTKTWGTCRGRRSRSTGCNPEVEGCAETGASQTGLQGARRSGGRS